MPQAKPRVRRAKAARAPTTPDAVEIAMEAEAADLSPDSPAQEVLRKHARLLDAQLRQIGLQTLSERLGAGLKIMLGLAGLVVAVILGFMVWDAAHDRSLVIKAFSAPPGMAADGLTGEVLASQLLDKLAVIDGKAQSLRAPETFRNDWGNDIQVEIPQTGVSIGELDRYLRQWLGKRTDIGGELVRRGDQVQLTVRIGTLGAVTATGPEADTDALLQQAAEAVFARTQPFRYSKYLEFTGRRDEAMKVAVDLAENGPASERAWAWAQISNLRLYIGDYPGAAAAGRRAIRLDPDLGLGWLNLAGAQSTLSHDAAAEVSYKESVRLMKSGRAQLSDIGVAIGIANNSAAEGYRRDHLAVLRVLQDVKGRTDYLGLDETQPALRIVQLILARDLSAAAQVEGVLPDAEMVRRTNDTSLNLPDLERRWQLEDWPGAEASLRQSIAAARGMGGPGVTIEQRFLQPRLAFVLMKQGRVAEAMAMIDGLPLDCDACLPMAGAVRSAAGDRAGADRLFQLAVRRTPDFPTASQEWGLALLARGEARAALARFREAQRLGPRWADPFKGEGDALMRLGRPEEAARAYREALERAPHWGGAHLQLARALTAIGKSSQARAEYDLARRSVLTAAERSSLPAAAR